MQNDHTAKVLSISIIKEVNSKTLKWVHLDLEKFIFLTHFICHDYEQGSSGIICNNIMELFPRDRKHWYCRHLSTVSVLTELLNSLFQLQSVKDMPLPNQITLSPNTLGICKTKPAFHC